jgi:hypothetical protein
MIPSIPQGNVINCGSSSHPKLRILDFSRAKEKKQFEKKCWFPVDQFIASDQSTWRACLEPGSAMKVYRIKKKALGGDSAKPIGGLWVRAGGIHAVERFLIGLALKSIIFDGAFTESDRTEALATVDSVLKQWLNNTKDTKMTSNSGSTSTNTNPTYAPLNLAGFGSMLSGSNEPSSSSSRVNN